MPTDKKRINITLPHTVDMVLEKVANRDNMPVASKAIQLLQVALEMEEDMVWDRVATSRDKNKSKFISHNEAWV